MVDTTGICYLDMRMWRCYLRRLNKEKVRNRVVFFKDSFVCKRGSTSDLIDIDMLIYDNINVEIIFLHFKVIISNAYNRHFNLIHKYFSMKKIGRFLKQHVVMSRLIC